MSDQQPPAQPPKKPALGYAWLEKGNNFKWAMGAMGVSLAVIFGLVAVLPSSDSGGGDSGPDQYGAQDVCEQFVTDRLKSPSSADFSNETFTMGVNNALWEVAGDVDAENSFGASLRSHFTCVVRNVGGHRWHLISLTGLN